ncbi:hypothetical protein HMPREF1870_01964 [Bacteroidales bacterium KA00344]|nr:hypothetical protein HMPREF1870_01964 [Bacteroidales bacterium KA00344]
MEIEQTYLYIFNIVRIFLLGKSAWWKAISSLTTRRPILAPF